MRTCKALGCAERTTRWGHFCNRHKANLRRHGAHDQRAVTVAELKPFRRRIRARITRNESSLLWAVCEANWQATVEHARAILAGFQTGQPGFRFERLAALELVKLADNVEPREVCETVWAMFLLLDEDPHRFTSDAAFRVQITRRVRGLTRANAAEWSDSTTGRVRRAYSEMSPRSAATLAGWITHAIGAVGVLLARLERQQREDRERRAEVMAEAAKELR